MGKEHWVKIRKDKDGNTDTFVCSACEKFVVLKDPDDIKKYTFCPFCGAKLNDVKENIKGGEHDRLIYAEALKEKIRTLFIDDPVGMACIVNNGAVKECLNAIDKEPSIVLDDEKYHRLIHALRTQIGTVGEYCVSESKQELSPEDTVRAIRQYLCDHQHDLDME